MAYNLVVCRDRGVEAYSFGMELTGKLKQAQVGWKGKRGIEVQM